MGLFLFCRDRPHRPHRAAAAAPVASAAAASATPAARRSSTRASTATSSPSSTAISPPARWPPPTMRRPAPSCSAACCRTPPTRPTPRPRGAAHARRTSLVLAVALPLAATGLYAWLGAPAALLPGAAQRRPRRRTRRRRRVEQMVAGLAARLEKNPDDPKGWSILARSYHAIGRFAEAEAAFRRIGDDLNRRSGAARRLRRHARLARRRQARGPADCSSCRRRSSSTPTTRWRCRSPPWPRSSARISPRPHATGSACCRSFRPIPTKRSG